MSRYIDAEAFKRKLIDEKSFFPAIVARALEEMPTADVVEGVHITEDILKKGHNDPVGEKGEDALLHIKQEVAREIFEEIEDVLNNIGYFDEIDFKALKNKYTESEREHNG